MPAPVLQFKRGNAGVAGTVPALRPGEPAISLNNFDFFIGFDTSAVNNKFFGSHRYWGREDGTTSLRFKLVDKDGNNGIYLKSPNTLSGIGTYTLPDTATIQNDYFLKVSSGGILSWEAITSNASFSNSTITGVTTVTGIFNNNADSDFSGITTFSNLTDNILGNPNSGAVQIRGGLGVNKNVTVGAGFSVIGQSYFIGTSTFYGGQLNLGDTDTDNINVVGEFISNLVPNTSNTYDLGLIGKRWRDGYFGGNLDVTGNLNVVGVSTVSEFTIGTGVAVTQFSASVSSGSSTSSIPTSKAVIDYIATQIGNVDLTLSINADTGGPSTVNTSQTLTIAGTVNEVDTSVSGQIITVGLPDAVIVGTSLSSPTIKTGTIQSSNTGSTVLTITGNDATFVDDLTVQGNLYVQGSTTQVDTTSLTIEDRTIELGRIVATQPSSTTWDLAILFNYGDGVAKKAGLVWEASNATKRFQFTTDVNTGTDGSDSQTNLPSFTVTNFAPIEISELWINNSCTGGAQQVIGCVGSELQLQNITIDAGSF